MKKFRWILLSGLLVAAPQFAQAQAPGASPAAPQQGFADDGRGGGSAVGSVGSISNSPSAATGTPLNPDGISPDAGFVIAGDAAFGDVSASSSSIPDTGGEPLIAVLAGLSIAGAAVAMRRKVTA